MSDIGGVSWETFKVPDLPLGESGQWRISRFNVTEQEANLENFRSLYSHHRTNIVPGEYTKLTRSGKIIMSDTKDEIRDHLQAIYASQNHCLIGGLGLGMVVNGCLSRPEVSHVTVVELSKDVINLVGDHYCKKFGDRLTIINDDIMTWKPPKTDYYDMAWFDIWDDICTDNLNGMATLNRRFGKKAKWKGCWKQELLKYYREREKRSGW